MLSHESRPLRVWLIFDVRQKMSATLHRIDFLRAALQVRGASRIEIETIIDGARKLAGADFDAWNQPMTERDQKLLAMMLGPKGDELAIACIDSFQDRLVSQLGISAEEIRKALKARLEGLN